MRVVSAERVRSFIVSRLHTSILEADFDPAALGDDFDILTSGVIDSIGLVELVVAVEQEFGLTLDLADLDPESLTVLGPLSRYIEEQSPQAGDEGSFRESSGNQKD
jgi:acyl carrier protein